ncbi:MULTISPECIES: class I SAM-dependent methyltransferase [Lactococcus]|uniref:class I SAM-dependent methyltransferase n=1 Tax=Lactococcus TaxID=1357 RepID=UPI00129E8568|nr:MULTISPECIES: class I SAM-dependent methyltransferase [Lactococcus]NHI79069.1 class I SAM-dependent methyltransferase [Lactococcus petauri]QSR01266.1 class I SAM-dependent methyltransferase [Lactococcus sp. LG1074]
MKENKYNNQEFFSKYAQMERSKSGLEAAGEWSELRNILPDFHNKKVLDLGCGYGWHCKYAVENGASYVLGTDISSKMLERATSKNSDEKITYQCIAMEDLCLELDSFDVVLSSLALHYIEDLAMLFSNIYMCLTTGGQFVFSVEHPLFTASGLQDWIYDVKGKKEYFLVDNYFYEGKRKVSFLGEEVTKYHRTLTTYLNTLLQLGFELQHVIEPQPPEQMLVFEEMHDELRRPMMLIVSARKK